MTAPYRTIDTFSAILDAEAPSRIENVTEIQDDNGKLICYAEPSLAPLLVETLNELSALRASHAELVALVQEAAENDIVRPPDSQNFPPLLLERWTVYGVFAKKALPILSRAQSLTNPDKTPTTAS